MRLVRHVLAALLLVTLGATPAGAAPPRTSVDSPRIAYFSWSLTGHGGETTSQEDIFTTDLAGKITRITNDTKNGVFVSDRDPAWSPDRRLIAIHRASNLDYTSRLYLIDARSGRTLKRLVPGISPEWADGVRLLYVDFDLVTDPVTGDLYAAGSDVFMIETGSLMMRRITAFEENVWVGGMSWHPTAGLALSYVKYDAEWNVVVDSVATIPAATVNDAFNDVGPAATSADATFVTLDAGILGASSPDWSPAGDRIAFSTTGRYVDPLAYSADVGVVDVATGAVTWVMQEPPGEWGVVLDDTDPAFSPNGTQVAWARGLEDQWREIHVYTFATGTSRRVTNETQARYKGGLDW